MKGFRKESLGMLIINLNNRLKKEAKKITIFKGTNEQKYLTIHYRFLVKT